MELGEIVDVVEARRRSVEIPDELRGSGEADEQHDDVDVDAPTV